MIRQNIQNFKLGTLRRTKVTASCGLALLMSFAKDIGLGKQLEFCFSHLKQRNRGYSVSAKILSFLQMIIKGGDRMSDIDLLRADPGLLALLRMEGFPRPNTLAELSRKFRQRDIHRLAECGMRLVVRALRLRKLRRVVLDIDSTLVESGVRIAERTYEGFWGFNPLLGMLRGGRQEEEVGEAIHFVGPEKEGAAYRLIVVRKRNGQKALFPEFEYTYRLYITNTDWSSHKVVRFYRKRANAENLIRELKEGYALDHILSEDFLANAVFFQLQLLAHNLVELFKYAHLERSWWRLRIKQLRFRLINIAGVIARHARRTVLRLSIHYRYIEVFRRVFQLLQVSSVELRL